MPAAPDLLTLFQFEKQIEAAVAIVLESMNVPTFRQQGATSLSTPRTEVKLHMGAPTGKRYAPPNALVSPAETYPEAFHAQIVLTTLTNRNTVVGNADRHDELVAKSRVAMLQAGALVNAQLDYLALQKVDDAGVVPAVHADEKLDLSPLVFALQFVVRREAWPAEVTGSVDTGA